MLAFILNEKLDISLKPKNLNFESLQGNPNKKNIDVAILGSI